MLVGSGKVIRWNGKYLGHFSPCDKGVVFVMKRKKDRHLFEMFGGSYGINMEFLKELVTTPACINIMLLEQEKNENGKYKTKTIMTSTPINWLNKCIPYRCKGSENQAHLKLVDFERVY